MFSAARAGQWMAKPPNAGRPVFLKLFTICCALVFLLSVQATPVSHSRQRDSIIYLIRHGEKPADGSDGLTRKGHLRAQCLKRLFGPKSHYRVDYIMAPDFDGEKHRRAYDTVLPLSKELGIKVDKHCGRKDTDCVADTISDKISAKRFKGDVLISWRHSNMDEVVKFLGVDEEIVPSWPPDRFDLIWTIYPNGTFTIHEQNCPHIDYLDEDGNTVEEPPMLIQGAKAEFLH